MEQVPELPAQNFILEPEGRGTAPAIGLATIHLLDKDPQACMVILTADHFITKTKHFCEVLAAAEKVADGRLVTLGIQPSDPSTGFGYIHQGALAGEENGFPFYAVERFTEKPDLATARKMVESGEYSWNSGMFVWQVSRILKEFQYQMPDFYALLMEVKICLGYSRISVCGRTRLASGKQRNHRLWHHGRRRRCGCNPCRYWLDGCRKLGKPGRTTTHRPGWKYLCGSL